MTRKIGKVVVDKDVCTGSANCVAIAPDVFDLDDDGKAKVKTIAGADAMQIMDAAVSCPVNAIIVYDDEGKQIYPAA